MAMICPDKHQQAKRQTPAPQTKWCVDGESHAFSLPFEQVFPISKPLGGFKKSQRLWWEKTI